MTSCVYQLEEEGQSVFELNDDMVVDLLEHHTPFALVVNYDRTGSSNRLMFSVGRKQVGYRLAPQVNGDKAQATLQMGKHWKEKTLQNLVEKGTVVLDGSPNVKRLEELGFSEERRIQTAFHLLYAEHEC
ncbi:hypothetical protein HDU99_007734, partial [Rhizoclosmatium hyalinum]